MSKTLFIYFWLYFMPVFTFLFFIFRFVFPLFVFLSSYKLMLLKTLLFVQTGSTRLQFILSILLSPQMQAAGENSCMTADEQVDRNENENHSYFFSYLSCELQVSL